MRRFGALFLPLLLAAAVSCKSGNTMPGSDKLDDFFDSISNQYMGSVAISKGGKTIYTHSIGYSDIDGGMLAGPGSKYMIGSISKTFTAVLVMKAVEEGKLSLDSKLSDFFHRRASRILTASTWTTFFTIAAAFTTYSRTRTTITTGTRLLRAVPTFSQE